VEWDQGGGAGAFDHHLEGGDAGSRFGQEIDRPADGVQVRPRDHLVCHAVVGVGVGPVNQGDRAGVFGFIPVFQLKDHVNIFASRIQGALDAEVLEIGARTACLEAAAHQVETSPADRSIR
jgi:hypothetical protein